MVMVMLMVLAAVAQNKYSKQLTEWLAETNSMHKKTEPTQLQFLTVRVQVKDAMNDGFSMKTIWKHLHEIEKISCSYRTFVRYVHRYIKAPSPDQDHVEQATSAKVPEKSKPNLSQANQPKRTVTKAPEKKAAEKKSSSEIPGFTFNPIPRPDEDLF